MFLQISKNSKQEKSKSAKCNEKILTNSVDVFFPVCAPSSYPKEKIKSLKAYYRVLVFELIIHPLK